VIATRGVRLSLWCVLHFKSLVSRYQPCVFLVTIVTTFSAHSR